MGWLIGSGLRETIQLDSVGADGIINEFLAFNIFGVKVPTGLLLVFFCVLYFNLAVFSEPKPV